MIRKESESEQLVLKNQLKRVKTAIDNQTGIISYVYEELREPTDPLIHSIGTSLSFTSRYQAGISDAIQNNGAAGLTRTRAMLGAIGESFERYSSAFYDERDFIWGSYNELVAKGHELYDPEQITFFSAKQYGQSAFPFHEFTKDTQVNWGWTELLCGEKARPILFPAFMIYMPYRINAAKGEKRIGPTLSTGQAAAFSSEKASLTGLLEVVERDAYTICWQNRLKVPAIDINSSPFIKKIYEERFSVSRLDIQLHYLTLDVDIPVVLCSAIDRFNPKLSVIIGVAAHLDPEIAALKALIEMAQDRFYIKFLVKTKDPVPYIEGFKHIDDFEKRVILYGDVRMIPVLDFLRNSMNKVISFSEIENKSTGDDEKDLQKIIGLLVEKGYNVIRKNITTPDIRDLGMHVVKMFVPEFQPLEGDHNLRFFGGKRLYQVPHQLGYFSKPPIEDDFNPYPHPLP